MKAKEYALYHGDEFIAVGTFEEVSKITGIPADTLRWYATNAHRRQVKDISKCYLMVKLEEGEETE